jgi:hypothetical protein
MRAHRNGSSTYAWAVNELTRQRVTVHLQDCEKLARYVEETRVEAARREAGAEKARLSLWLAAVRLNMLIEGLYGFACGFASQSERDVKMRHIGFMFLG